MTSPGKRPINAPLSRRIQLFAKRFGTVTVWSALVVCLGLYLLREPGTVTVQGVAELPETNVAPVMDGVIAELAVGMKDSVLPGQTLAVMDDSLCRAEWNVADAELTRLRAQLDAERETCATTKALEERKELDEQRRFAMNLEDARIEQLQLAARQEADAVELERLKLACDREAALYPAGMTPKEDYDNARLRYESLKKKVDENAAALSAAKERRKETATRQAELRERPVDTDLERILEPVRQAIAVQEARIAEIQARQKQLILVASGAGQVTTIAKRAGETVLAGQTILTLCLAGSLRVVACYDEKRTLNIHEGMPAVLTSLYRAGVSANAEVARIGAQIEPFPIRLSPPAPLQQPFGTILLLEKLDIQAFRPGELVSVTLTANPGPS